MSSEKSELLLEDGSDESSFRCLQRFFFLLFIFFFLESDEDVSDESGDEDSRSWFTSGSCSFSFFSKNFVGRVSSSKFVGRVISSKSVGRVNLFLYVGRVSEILNLVQLEK